MGSDITRYIKSFPRYPTFEDLHFKNIILANKEIGWYILNVIIRSTFNDFFFINLLTAGFLNIFIYYLFYKYSKYPFLCLLFYFTLSFFHISFEILRQDIATIFFLWGATSLLKNDRKGYLLKAFPCIFFHNSAIIIYIIAFLFSFFKPNKGSLFLPLFLYVLSSTVAAVIPNIILITGGLGDDYINQYEFYVDSDIYGASDAGVIQLIKDFIISIVPPFLLLFIVAKKNCYLGLRRLVYIYFLFRCLMPAMFIFYRFTTYVELFYFILLSDILISSFRSKKFTPYILLLYCCTTITLFYSIYNYTHSKKFPDSNGYDFRYFPYTAIWDKDEQVINKRKAAFF